MIGLLWGKGTKSKSGPQITQITQIKSGYVVADSLVGGPGRGKSFSDTSRVPPCKLFQNIHVL